MVKSREHMQVDAGGGSRVSEPGAGEFLPLEGYGALKGQFEMDPRIDLTKPIHAQVLRLERAERRRKMAAGDR